MAQLLTHDGPPISDKDFEQLSNATQLILEKAQTFVDFPAGSKPQPDQENDGAVQVSYAFSGFLEVKLEIEWNIFSKFVLQDVRIILDLAVANSISSNWALGFGIRATFKIGEDAIFAVSGQIPNLQSDHDTDFVLTLTLMDTRKTVDVQDLLTKLDSKLKFNMDGTPEGIQEQLPQGSEARNVVSARLVVRRDGGNKNYYLQSLSVALAAGFDWSPTKSITLKRLSCMAMMSRKDGEAPWNYHLEVAGNFTIKDSEVVVKAMFDLAQTTTITLSFTVKPQMRLSAFDILEVLAQGTRDDMSKDLERKLPPNLKDLSSMSSGSQAITIEASLSIGNSLGEWALESVALAVRCPGAVWFSPKSDLFPQVVISNLRVEFGARQVKLQAEPTLVSSVVRIPFHKSVECHGNTMALDPNAAATKWKCAALVGGSISLRGGAYVLPVAISYDSKQETVAVLVSIADGVFAALTDLAGDNTLLPYGETPPNLRDWTQTNVVPAESPVSLGLAVDPLGGSERSMRLWFSSSKLTRFMLSARYADQEWQITPQIKIVRMGIVFDMASPCDSDENKRVMAGYAYGTMHIGSVETTLFVAAINDAKASEFWAHLSARPVSNVDPRATLEMQPGTALQDGQLMGRPPPDNAQEWNIPDSYPVSLAGDVYKNETSASLRVKFSRPTGETERWNLDALELAVAATGKRWQLYDELVMTSGRIMLSIQNPRDKAKMTGTAKLAASFETTGSQSTKYVIYLSMECSRAKDTKDTTFWATLEIGQKVPASAIAALKEFGSLSLEKKLDGQMPGDYPIQPDRFNIVDTHITLVTKILVDQPTGQSATLKQIYFKLSTAAEWSITSGISLSDPALELTIENPLKSPRYVLVGSGQLSIAQKIRIGALVKLSTGPESRLCVKLSVGSLTSSGVSAAEVLKALLDSDCNVIPPGCPVDPSQTSTSADFVIEFSQEGKGNSWVMKSIRLSIKATVPWKVDTDGKYLVINELDLDVSITNMGSGKPLITVVTVTGVSQISSDLVVKVTGQYNSTTASLMFGLRVHTGTMTAAAITTKYLPDWQKRGDKPAFTADSGLSKYDAIPLTGEVLLAFKHTSSSSWNPDSLSIGITTDSSFQWSLVNNYLALTKLGLYLHIDDLSAPKPSIYGLLGGTLRYTAMDDGRYLGNAIDLSLRATAKQLRFTATMPGDGCSLPDAVFVATSGRIRVLKGICKWPNVKELRATMDWDAGLGSFEAELEAFAPPFIKEALTILRPTLSLGVSRTGGKDGKGRFGARGEVSGVVEIAGAVRIPVSYELPNGPLRIFGLDVKKIYDMVKALWELFRDIMEIAEAIETICVIMLEVGGFVIGAAVGAALIALEIAHDVWSIVKKIFGDGSGGHGGGGHGGDHSGSHADPSKNPGGAWVVGGTGAVNGRPFEPVSLNIYPKDKTGNSMVVDITKLDVQLVSAGTSTPITGWLYQDPAGYTAKYQRPASLGDYTLTISYPPADPPYKLTLALQAIQDNATPSWESVLDAPTTCVPNVINQLFIWPLSKTNQRLLGMPWASLFNVKFNPEPLSFQYATYNDALAVSWVPRPGDEKYQIIAELSDGTEITNSGQEVYSRAQSDVNLSFASGPGLCSGPPRRTDAFTVTVLDTVNRAFDCATSNVWVEASAFGFDTNGCPEIKETGRSGNQVMFEYTRPVTTDEEPECSYYIAVRIAGVPLIGSPFRVVTTKTSVEVAPELSMPTMATNLFVKSETKGSIAAYDSLGNRWRMQLKDWFKASVVKTVTEDKGDDPATTLTLTDRGDGTALFTYTPTEPGNYQVDLMNITKPKTWFPFKFTVQELPEAKTLRCFGPSLELPKLAGLEYPYFDIAAYDQTDSIFSLNTSKAALPKDTIDIATDYTQIEHIHSIERHGLGYRVFASPNTGVGDPGDGDGDDPPPNSTLSLLRISSKRNGIEFPPSPFEIPCPRTTTGGAISFPIPLSYSIPPNSLTVPPQTFLITAFGPSTISPAIPGTETRRISGGDTVSIPASAENRYTILSITDLQDGTYRVAFVPLTATSPSPEKLSFSLPVFINGIAVTGSPFTLPERATMAFEVSGEGAGSAERGVEAKFTVKVTVSEMGEGGKGVKKVVTDAGAVRLRGLVYFEKPRNARAAVQVGFKLAGEVFEGLYMIPEVPAFPVGRYKLRVQSNWVSVVEGGSLDVLVS